MIPLEKPYFMQNKEWYYHDGTEFIYKLTDKAPEKAIKSYEEFYSMLENNREVLILEE